MAGGNPKASSHKPSPSSSNRKSRWEGNKPPADKKPAAAATDQKPSSTPTPTAAAAAAKPSPKPNSDLPSSSNPKPNLNPNPSPGSSKPPSDLPTRPGLGPGPGLGPDSRQGHGSGPPFPDPALLGPPPPPAYGFHMLDRRTIVLADGSVRSYFALPQDYKDFNPLPRPMDLAARFRPPSLLGPGPEAGNLGFDKHRFPPGGPMSPEGFRDREDPLGRNRPQDYWNSLGLDGRGPPPPENLMKRKYGEDEERVQEELARQRKQLLHYGNLGSNLNSNPNGLRNEFLGGTSSPFGRDIMDPNRGGGDELRASKYMRIGGGYENLASRHGGVADNESLKHNDVDQVELKKAFLRFVKLVNENPVQKRAFLEDGKRGPLPCLACARSSKDFPDMHGLIMHTYNPDNADSLVDHLALHKALCVLMGWNHSKPPENSKAYQLLPADEAAANQDDLIMWPPVVIIHNTITGKGKDGRIDGLGNKAMDHKLRDLGFPGAKAKSLFGKDGHLGVTMAKFSGDESGLKEAVRLGEHFEKSRYGRKAWAAVQIMTIGIDDENNPNLVTLDDKTGEKKRIFYGYLGTIEDLDKLDFESKKKVTIESRRDYNNNNPSN